MAILVPKIAMRESPKLDFFINDETPRFLPDEV